MSVSVTLAPSTLKRLFFPSLCLIVVSPSDPRTASVSVCFGRFASVSVPSRVFGRLFGVSSFFLHHSDFFSRSTEAVDVGHSSKNSCQESTRNSSFISISEIASASASVCSEIVFEHLEGHRHAAAAADSLSEFVADLWSSIVRSAMSAKITQVVAADVNVDVDVDVVVVVDGRSDEYP